MYEKAQAEQAAQAGPEAAPAGEAPEDVVDADYEVVDE